MCNPWYLYILLCKDRSLYTGITRDLNRRIEEHNNGKKAARYTRSRRPVQLVYVEEYSSRSEASKREYAVKSLAPKEKLRLILDADLAHHQTAGIDKAGIDSLCRGDA